MRQDLLIAPLMTEEDSKRGWRHIYLPRPDSWFIFNLSCTNSLNEDLVRHPLEPRLHGGSEMKVEARIPSQQSDMLEISKVTPMFIREGTLRDPRQSDRYSYAMIGAIIPTIKPRAHVPDRTREDCNAPVNAITLNVYPGKNNVRAAIPTC